MEQIENSETNLTSLNLLGYTRVSTYEQTKGHSLEFQKDEIIKFCKVHNHNLIDIFSDKGISAYKERPQFQKMMQRLPYADGVIVYDITRFGRNTVDLLTQITTIDNSGKAFISIKDSIDLTTRTGRLLMGLLSLIADYERQTTMERMESGRELAKIKGTKSGKPMHRPPKVINWDKVKELRAVKLSWTKIAPIVGVSTPTLIKHAREKGLYD